MREVVIVADASHDHALKVGGIAWIVVVDGEVVERGGRSVFNDIKGIDDLEIMAVREGLQASRRFRRTGPWGKKVRTSVITDNVTAFIKIPPTAQLHSREYFLKYLLKTIPNRLKFTRALHRECDKIAYGMLEIARGQVNG